MIMYEGKKLKFIKDYGNWILFEDEHGFKEGIHKHDLGLIREKMPKPKNVNPEKVIYI